MTDKYTEIASIDPIANTLSIEEFLERVGNFLLFGENAPEIPQWLFHRIVLFILKPGKPVTDEDSFRGLSMLKNIFKMYSKLIATRMAAPLRHIQNPQQFGFTKNKGCLEASRSVIDSIKAANLEGLPLIVLSTYFYKAFDSIALDHVENCLRFYQFPEKFTTAFMRLVRGGTVQFEINGMLSEDKNLDKGVGQGDPKSSFGFNIAAAPLNHYLATSPDVPRFKAYNIEVGPVFFADDNLTVFQGNEIDGIIRTLHKIIEYRKVSGMTLNLSKCEIMTINCDENEVQRLLTTTGMKRTYHLKHLGLIINTQGQVTHDQNIGPVERNMEAIAETYNTSQSTPLGRAIYAKYLLASKYIHRIQNTIITTSQLDDLRRSILNMTWTRARPAENTLTYRVHRNMEVYQFRIPRYKSSQLDSYG